MKTPSNRGDALWLAALLAALLVVSLFRPLLPIDETRYASVAWEMWVRGDFLVPFRNGEPYHHKPPLLFWLMHAGWAVFGVNEWWPRLISPLFAAGTLVLTYQLGRRLWPQWPEVARMAPFILLASALFVYFASALMFDVMIAFFVALGLLGLVRAWQTGAGTGGFVLLALGLGGALFAKGPVALLHLLPPALLAPWWMRANPPPWRRWYLGVWLAVLGGAVLILAWAVPAGMSGGDEYRNAIFWGQTAGRMTRSFAHQAPWWFYLAWLPLMLAPWLLWPRWWRNLHRGLWAESGFRLAVLCTMFGLLAFSLISGKRWHYLLPQFVPFALIAARALHDSRPGRGSLALQGGVMAALGLGVVLGAPRLATGLGSPAASYALYGGGAVTVVVGAILCALRPGSALRDVRIIATATVVIVVALATGANLMLREPYDVSGVAGQLAQFEREGRPVAVEGEYHGQWHLAGRLRRPLVELSADEVPSWLGRHPQGRVVFIYRHDSDLPPGLRIVHTQQRYRGQKIAILAAPE